MYIYIYIYIYIYYILYFNWAQESHDEPSDVQSISGKIN